MFKNNASDNFISYFLRHSEAFTAMWLTIPSFWSRTPCQWTVRCWPFEPTQCPSDLICNTEDDEKLEDEEITSPRNVWIHITIDEASCLIVTRTESRIEVIWRPLKN